MIEVEESSGRLPEVLRILLEILLVSTIDNSGARTFTKLSSGSFQFFHSFVAGLDYLNGTYV
jgi:hypothetical protein